MLSKEARELLVEACRDKHGQIIKVEDLGLIQTNGKQFTKEDDPRSTIERWGAAIEELESRGMIRGRHGKGLIYHVTNKGYVACDLRGARQQ